MIQSMHVLVDMFNIENCHSRQDECISLGKGCLIKEGMDFGMYGKGERNEGQLLLAATDGATCAM